MGRCAPFVTVVILGLNAWGCGIGPGASVEVVSPAPPTLSEGAEFYREACAACHGSTGKGDGSVAPALKSAPSDLTRLSQRHDGVYPRELVMRTIEGDNAIAAHGTREMPVWSSRFSPAGHGATAVAATHVRRQVGSLVAYVESLQRR